MKNYQFAVLAGLALLLVVGVGVQLNRTKKKCGCKDHAADEAATLTPTE